MCCWTSGACPLIEGSCILFLFAVVSVTALFEGVFSVLGINIAVWYWYREGRKIGRITNGSICMSSMEASSSFFL